NVDVVGLGNFFHDRLYSGDTIRAMAEILTGKVRYFLEIERPGSDPAKRLYRTDRTVDGDLHAALGEMALDISYYYHGSLPMFSGMNDFSFREFVKALDEFDKFLADCASASRLGRPIPPGKLDSVIAKLDGDSLADARSAYLYSLKASLHKLNGNLSK